MVRAFRGPWRREALAPILLLHIPEWLAAATNTRARLIWAFFLTTELFRDLRFAFRDSVARVTSHKHSE